MSALNNLAAFVYKLPDELQPEFMKLVDAVTDERERLQNERIANNNATTGTFEVVAIAGTAETLLNDVTDTNVGEINVGDTVELNPNIEQDVQDKSLLVRDAKNIFSLNKVTYKKVVDNVSYIEVNNGSYIHRELNFRKVSTPSINPLNSVEGC